MTEPAIQPWEYCANCRRPLGTIDRGRTVTIFEGWPTDHNGSVCWECYKAYRDSIGDPVPPALYRLTEHELVEEYKRRGMQL